MDQEHSEYAKHKRNWKLVRDLIQGEKALKDNDLAKVSSIAIGSTKIDSYLPYTSQTIDGPDIARYKTYVERASLFNATRRTEKGMVGMVYNKPSISEFPPQLEYLNYDVDGTGVGIMELTVETLEDILETGRAGLFVDYPSGVDIQTISDMDTYNYRANIIKYRAEQIMDWDVVNDGATQMLSFVKLKECMTMRDPDDIFKTIEVETYRVLLLNELGQYEQREYISDDEYTSTVPTDNLGEPFGFIPFFFIGATDNRPDVDIAPLLEIAELNIKHYRNSADYEESTFLVGQPMVGVIGVSQTWVDDNYPDGMLFGSRVCLMLPMGADIKLLQADPNTMSKDGMIEKEKQMLMLGARLITDGTQNETAEAARIRHSADSSVLKVIVKNITAAFTKAIYAVQIFNGDTQEFEFKLNDDFFASTMNPQELSALVSAWQSGAISSESMNAKLEKSGITDK